MSSSAYTCFGCDASYSTRKQLSAHASQCRLNRALADQVFERKRKSSKKRTKDEKRARPTMTADPQSLRMHANTLDQAVEAFDDMGPAVPFDDTDHEVSYPHPSLHITDILKQFGLTEPGPSSLPPPVISQRSGCPIHMPARFVDFLPGSSTHLAHMPLSARQEKAHLPQVPQVPVPSSPSTSDHSSSGSGDDAQPKPFVSEPDSFGLYRTYFHRPTFVPLESLVTACDAPTLDTGDILSKGFVPPQSAMGPGEGEDAAPSNIFAPFTNPTCGLLMAWQYTGTNQKSAAELDQLVKIQMDPLQCRGSPGIHSYSRDETS